MSDIIYGEGITCFPHVRRLHLPVDGKVHWLGVVDVVMGTRLFVVPCETERAASAEALADAVNRALDLVGHG